MGESLMKRHRVNDEVRKDVKFFFGGRILTVPQESATANYVPAAAVIRRSQALSGIIGRKAYQGGLESWMLNISAQPRNCIQNF